MKQRLLVGILSWMLCAHINLHTEEPSCFRELETTFFIPQIVSEALSIHNVDMNIWPLINQQLRTRSQTIPNLVRDRANRMSPNPLNSPFQADVAAELLRQVLLEVFTSVIHDFRLSSGIVANEYDIKDMFGYIRRQQKNRIEGCLGENAMEPNPGLLTSK